MQKFPFAVVYQVSKEAIQVVAVAHCKRKPEYLALKDETVKVTIALSNNKCRFF